MSTHQEALGRAKRLLETAEDLADAALVISEARQEDPSDRGSLYPTDMAHRERMVGLAYADSLARMATAWAAVAEASRG